MVIFPNSVQFINRQNLNNVYCISELRSKIENVLNVLASEVDKPSHDDCNDLVDADVFWTTVENALLAKAIVMGMYKYFLLQLIHKLWHIKIC